MDHVARRRQQAEHLVLVGRHTEAASTCRAAIASAPDRADLHTLLSRIHLLLQEPDNARDAAERSLALDPGGVEAMRLLAIALRLLGEHERSLQLLDAALSREPQLSALHLGRALTLVDRELAALAAGDDVDPPQLDEAERAAGAAQELAPENAGPHHVLGLVAVARGDEPGAASHVLDALALEPGWPDAHLLLGRIRARQGMSRLASRHFAEAGVMSPSDGAALDHLRTLVSPPPTGRVGRLLRRVAGGPAVRVVPEAARILSVDRDLGGSDG